MIGILLVNKPSGISSHDVIYKVRRGLQTKRAGHAGTLDPLAEGLLVVAVGPATRFLQYLDLEPKVYQGVFRFGVETTTYDDEGETVAEKPVPSDLDAAIEGSLHQYLGEIDQLPPMYSAVKKDGKALYHYAREGKEVERQSRRVFVKEFACLGAPEADQREFRIVCSGGTYVRTLAHDLGQKVGCGAYLHTLVRTQVGGFTVEQAVSVDDIPMARLIPLAKALDHLPQVRLNETQTNHVREGRDVRPSEPIKGPYAALLDPEGRVISVAKPHGPLLHPECVIPAEAMDDSV